MADTLTLLSMTHSEALTVMLQESLKPGVSANALEPGYVTYGVGTNAEVSIHLKSTIYQDPSWIYRGQIGYNYRRLDLADFFQGINLEFRRRGQFKMASLVTAINQIFQIQIEQSDFVNSDIIMVAGIDQVVTLQAYPNSRRWKGSVPITILYNETDVDGLYGNQDGQVYENQDEAPYTPGDE